MWALLCFTIPTATKPTVRSRPSGGDLWEPAMSAMPTFSPSTMDFLGQLDRTTNGLPENQRREFEMAVETELEDVLNAFNAEYETASEEKFRNMHMIKN
ncbi:hypothetical protein GCK32_007984 [Trichostrongylus colubriformis]|uniref:Uncharacterized protein n=2 Tax=Trichostrongylus colubriformis TaxID=6319 RepID=A0AAN8EV32_TRICO